MAQTSLILDLNPSSRSHNHINAQLNAYLFAEDVKQNKYCDIIVKLIKLLEKYWTEENEEVLKEPY